MTSPDRSGPVPSDLDDLDENSAPQVRRFLEAIAHPGQPGYAPEEAIGTGPSGAAPTRLVDRDRQVMRFAWTSEELNVAFADMDTDDPATLHLLREHGVDLTLAEIQVKAADLAAAIERAPRDG